MVQDYFEVCTSLKSVTRNVKIQGKKRQIFWSREELNRNTSVKLMPFHEEWDSLESELSKIVRRTAL